mgnify:CR=1 FL=1
MIIKIKVAVPVNGKFFPNEMQIAFHEGLPFVQSPNFTTTSMKSLQLKLKVIFKCIGLKFPKKKIFITFKNQKLIPTSYQFLETPIVLAVFKYMNLTSFLEESYYTGSLDLTGTFLISNSYQQKYQEFIDEFCSNRKFFFPGDFERIHPNVFRSQESYLSRSSFEKSIIHLPRILTLALNIQHLLGVNILFVDPEDNAGLLMKKIKLLKSYISLEPRNYNLNSEFNEKLFFDTIADASKSELKSLKSEYFHSCLGVIKPCPCGKLLTTEKCRCGVNYTKTFYKNFSPRFFSKFPIVLYLDNQLMQSTCYKFQWFESIFDFDTNQSLSQKIQIILDKWSNEAFFPIFKDTDSKLLLASLSQLEN